MNWALLLRHSLRRLRHTRNRINFRYNLHTSWVQITFYDVKILFFAVFPFRRLSESKSYKRDSWRDIEVYWRGGKVSFLANRVSSSSLLPSCSKYDSWCDSREQKLEIQREHRCTIREKLHRSEFAVLSTTVTGGVTTDELLIVQKFRIVLTTTKLPNGQARSD